MSQFYLRLEVQSIRHRELLNSHLFFLRFHTFLLHTVISWNFKLIVMICILCGTSTMSKFGLMRFRVLNMHELISHLGGCFGEHFGFSCKR